MARKRNKLKKRHIKLARSTRYEQDESFFRGKSPEELVELAFAKARKMGYRIVERHRGTSSITGPFTLYIGKNFKTYHPIYQAAVAWHEDTHVEQWADPRSLFLLRYPIRRFQWAFETHGYRQQVRVVRALAGDDEARKMAYGIPNIMQKRPYTMRRLDRRHVRLHTLRAFEIGIPGLKLL